MSGAAPEPIAPDQMPHAWRALAASFDEDPMFRYLLPEERPRRRWLEVMMAQALHQCAADAEMVVAPAPGAASGAMGMVRPGAYPPKERLWSFLFGERPGIPWPSRRLLGHGRRVLRAMSEHHHRDPHLYIMVVGVHPDTKGRGLGRQLMEHAIAVAEAAGVPAYLETSNPVNLGFYRRFGFETVAELPLPDGVPPVWTMLRS